MKTALFALVLNLIAASLSSAQTLENSCKPAFTATARDRTVPWSFVQQGLKSIPLLYPKHVLLAQRGSSAVGDVDFSLLVYKEDRDKPDVTVEGMAAHELRAWFFTAHCSTDNLIDGLVTVLEEIAKLSRLR